MRITKRNWGRKAVLLLTLMNLIAGVVALRPALTSRAAAATQSGWKEGIVTQMIDLESTIVRLKRQLAASPKDATLKEQLAAALNQYDQLSAQMGGDRAPVTGKSTPSSAPTLPSGGLGVVPLAPSGCTPTTANTTNSTPVAIPTGPAVVTSTITVAGAGTYLWDLNMQTFITHTFNADLDITLQSPAGTVVTITTDNGGSNDNVFNGTVWDDQANPGGQVPYTSNNGLVTDAIYTNLVTQTPLVPEEAMGAFVGENPNGTWTLSISDDLVDDGGNLASWELEVTTFSSVPTPTVMTTTNSTPVAIPTGPAVVTSTITVAGAGASLCDLNMTTFITHTFASDLDITLQSPAGTVVTMTTDNGAGNDNVFNGTVWDDQANPGGQVPYTTNNGVASDHAYVNLVTATPLVPEEAMAAFAGQNPNGVWTLTISDDAADDGGSLDRWSLQVTTCACGAACTSITCPANITTSNTTGQCGAVVTYPAPTPNGSCGTITCSPASGSFFPVGTTTVTCTSSAGPTCTFTVRVNDTQFPTITCPANVTRSNDPNQCGAVVTYPPPTVSDNCPGFSNGPACSPASGSFFPVGTTTVTCGVSDSSVLESSCTFTVRVNDTQPPVITCPANVTAVTNQTVCVAGGCQVVNFPAPVASDNCPGLVVACVPASGSCFAVGVTTVTCTATDTSNNATSCSFTVTTFDVALQDDSTPSTILLWNSQTGAYRFCCGGATFTGVGATKQQGCVFTLTHTPSDRRVLGKVDKAVFAGNASIQAPAGTIRCTIGDRNTRVSTNITQCQ